MIEQNTYIKDGKTYNQWGQVKVIEPQTGIVSWMFECDIPTKAGYKKGAQSREHRLRRSEALRTSPVWEYYDELFTMWENNDMPSSYEFAKIARVLRSDIVGIKEFRFDNMVKHFREDKEEQLSNLLKPNTFVVAKINDFCAENVEVEETKPTSFWWDDVEDSYYHDDTFGRMNLN